MGKTIVRIIRDFIAADDDFELPAEIKNGTIFEFKTIVQAKAFADEVKRLFDLESRVSDNVEEAYRAHMNPFVQTPPVVHVDRPTWGYFKIHAEITRNFKRAVKRQAKEADAPFIEQLPMAKKFDAATIEQMAAEKMLVALAQKFGGTWIGT
jgi:hypothetical protein